MPPTIRAANDEALPQILHLLTAAQLPIEGVAEHRHDFLVAHHEGTISGCIGLEVYGRVGLLRSLVVHPHARGYGLGRTLVEAQLARARQRELRSLYLLTTTAEEYFPRFGFEPIPRSAVDPLLNASAEMRGACPDSAICMRLSLGDTNQLG